jgi:hypothetical protein
MPTSVTLKKPGVEVYQIFEEQRPTALVPALIPVIIGQNLNCQYQIRCGGVEAGQISGSTFIIPTGDTNIEGQIITAATLRVFISTTIGIFEITNNAAVTVNLDVLGTLTDTITISGPLGTLTKTIISELSADSISTYTDPGGSKWVRVYDKSADFLGTGVAVGDVVELNEDPTDPNSTVNNKNITLRVVQIESSVMLKCARTDIGWGGTGNPVTSETNIKYDVSRSVLDPVGDVLATYNAVRLDDLHTLQWHENTAVAEDILGEAIPTNLLSFGVLLALQSTGRQVASIKVKNDSLSEFSKALEILEGYDLYGLVPLTFDGTAQGAVISHVNATSLPENKKERTALLARTVPNFVTKTPYIGSDLDDPVYQTATASDNGDGTSDVQFAMGVDISSASIGDIVRVDPSGGVAKLNGNNVDNDDITLQIIEVSSPVRTVTVLGDITQWNGTIVAGAGVPATDYAAITTSTLSGLALANYVQEQNASLANRRVVSLYPENVPVSATFYEMDESTLVVAQVTRVQQVPAYFAACSIAGQVAQWKSSQPHTSTPVLGLSGALQGSTGYLSETALQVIAAGGTWILEQLNENSFITTRHQLTTDMTSVETREYSITKQVDFGAKVMRLFLEPIIGPNVVTDKLLKNQIWPAAQAALYSLKREGHWGMNSKIDDIRVDSTDPTKVLVDVDVYALYPLVNITATLYV